MTRHPAQDQLDETARHLRAVFLVEADRESALLEERLAAYVDGRLAAEESAELEGLVAERGDLSAALDELLELRSVLEDEERGNGLLPWASPRRPRRRLAVALEIAALAAVLVLAILLPGRERRSVPLATPSETPELTQIFVGDFEDQALSEWSSVDGAAPELAPR